MLPKQYSFKLRQERGFFDKAQKYFSRYFTLFYIPAERPHLVVVVPKKAVKLATGRNALKRTLYATAVTTFPDLENTSTGFFGCLVAKSAAVTAPKAQIKKDFLRACELIRSSGHNDGKN